MDLVTIDNSIKTAFSTDYEFGDSFKFLNMKYLREPNVKLSIGDELIIHPVPNVSQATKSYPVKIVCKEFKWAIKDEDGEFESVIKNELCIAGRNENSGWHGAVLNDYGFGRLEFVRRGIMLL